MKLEFRRTQLSRSQYHDLVFALLARIHKAVKAMHTQMNTDT